MKGALVGLLCAGGVLSYSSTYYVKADQRAVIFSRILGVKPEVIPQGIHLRIPFIQYPRKIDIKTRSTEVGSEYGTKDLQVVKIQLRVLSRPQIQKLPEIYRSYGNDYDDKEIVSSIVIKPMKQVIAKYNASMLLTNCDQVTQEIRESIQRRARDFHIDIEDVSIIQVKKVGTNL